MNNQAAKPTISVLFVCLGNICRSPSCEGVFRKLALAHQIDVEIEIDSAGTGNYHIGHPPDARAIAAAARRDIDISDLRARQAHAQDMEIFDYVIAMDRMNHEDLMRLSPRHARSKIRLLMEFAHNWPDDEVPDPYYGGKAGFDRVLDMIEDASEGLIADIRRRFGDT